MDGQLSFIDLVSPPKEAEPTVWEKLAAGLKANRMGQIDREEYLQEQARKMNERK